MLSCEPEVLRGYKRVIDEGFAATFADGLRIETKANREHARSLTAGSDRGASPGRAGARPRPVERGTSR